MLLFAGELAGVERACCIGENGTSGLERVNGDPLCANGAKNPSVNGCTLGRALGASSVRYPAPPAALENTPGVSAVCVPTTLCCAVGPCFTWERRPACATVATR